MIEFSGAQRARLFTIWGTVLYVDGESGELRHGPIDNSPENAAFLAAPAGDPLYRQGSIVHRRDGMCEPVAFVAERCVSIGKLQADDAPAATTRLELVPLERGLTAMRRENLFLSAEPDGRVTLSRKWCSIWECFFASEDWFVLHSRNGDAASGEATHPVIDRKGIAKFLIDAQLRAKVNAESKLTKVLIYGYPLWSHGRVYYISASIFMTRVISLT